MRKLLLFFAFGLCLVFGNKSVVAFGQDNRASSQIEPVLTTKPVPVNTILSEDTEPLYIATKKSLSKRDQALLWAAKNGYAWLVRVLIKAGADVNVQDQNGRTPLYFAAYFGHKNSFKILVNEGAFIDVCSLINIAAHIFMQEIGLPPKN